MFRPITFAALALCPGPVAAQEPAPKAEPTLWLASYDLKASPKTMVLFGYAPDGKRVKEVALGVDPHDPNFFFGLTRDGKTALFAGKGGKLVEATVNKGLTLHTRRLDDPKAAPFDTGIPAERTGGSGFLPSPDGKLVAANIVGQLRPGWPKYEAALFDLTTGKKRDVKLPADTHVSLWSPDGRFLYGQWVDPAPRGPMTVAATKRLRIAVADGKVEELPDDHPVGGAFSPDGKSILTPGEKQIVRYDLGAKKLTTIATEPRLTGASVAWSPDGSKVMYFGRFADPDPFTQGLRVKDVSLKLVVCDPDGRNAKSLFEIQNASEQSLIFAGWTE